MFTIAKRFIWVWLLLIASSLISCSPGSTPPGASSIGGAVDGGSYSYHFWEEGLAILFWQDTSSGSGESCSGTGSTEDPVYRLECNVSTLEGRNYSWRVHTEDGVTAEMWIEDQPIDLSKGAMFLVSIGEDGVEVEQLQRDLTALERSNEAIAALAESDPDVSDYITGLQTGGDSPAAGDEAGLAELTEALQLSGLSVENGGPVGQPFFHVPGQILMVDGEDVQVFEYADSAAVQIVTARISPDASTVGQSIMSWVVTPHFYAKDRLIVLYVGDNEQVAAALVDVLGAAIAEGQPPILSTHDESSPGSGPGGPDLLTALPEALANSQYDVLSEMIGDPFGLETWGSPTRFLDPSGAIEELRANLLPDTSELTFTTDRTEFPDLGRYDPDGFWGSEGQAVDLIYSQGWGPDGRGEAILIVGLKADGAQFWRAMIYSAGKFSDIVALPPDKPALSYEATVYRNESDNFELSYPAAWEIEESVLGSRASGAQFYLYGEPIFSATVYLWDPKKDLDAYGEHRKLGWSSSSTVVAEEELALADGHRAIQYEIQGPDGSTIYAILAEVGEKYLELSGPAELNEFFEIAQTLHFMDG